MTTATHHPRCIVNLTEPDDDERICICDALPPSLNLDDLTIHLTPFAHRAQLCYAVKAQNPEGLKANPVLDATANITIGIWEELVGIEGPDAHDLARRIARHSGDTNGYVAPL